MNAEEPVATSLFANRYRLIREIGRGAMGSVYEAVEVPLDRTVALKRLTPDPENSLEARQRFRREVTAAAKLAHPGVAHVLGYGTTKGGEAFIAMELVEGRNLRRELEEARSFGVVLALFEQILAVLSYAHARGVIHRDLKPENILVTKVGSAPLIKLLDFGVARHVGVETPPSDEIVGTPRYMAPEQVLADHVGPAADLYSVGVMLFEALTGEPPISGRGKAVMRKKLYSDAPRMMQSRFGEVSCELSDLLEKLLARDPQLRIDSAADAAAQLRKTPEASDQRRFPPTSERIVEAPETIRDRHGEAVPFVGRKRAREALVDALAEVEQSRESRAVIVEGPTGIGKTHLLEWFTRQVREEGGRTLLAGTYVAAGGPDGDALRSAFIEHMLAWGKQRQALKEAVAQFLSALDQDDPELIEQFVEWLRPSHIDAESATSESRRSAECAMCDRICRRMAKRRPLVVLLDDVQWGGRSAFAQLAYSLAIAKQFPAPVLFVASVETPIEQRNLRLMYQRLSIFEGSLLRRVQLGPLSTNDVRRLAIAVLDTKDVQAIEEITFRASGNPLFLLQLARLANDRGLDDGPPPESVPGTRAHRRTKSSLPSSIKQLLEARIDAATARSDNPELALTVMTQIAILLPPVPTKLLELALSEMCDALEGASIVDELVNAGIVRDVVEGGVECLDFEHPLVGETLLERVHGRAMRRHNATALALKEAYYADEPERVVHELAEHAHHADLHDRARELSLTAAKRALGASRFGEAMKFLKRLSDGDTIAGSTTAPELALLASRAADETGESKFAERILALALSHDGAHSVDVLLALARAQIRIARIEEAEKLLEKAERAIEPAAGDNATALDPLAREVRRLRASAARRRGDFRGAIGMLLTLLRDPSTPARAARLLHDNLAWCHHRLGDEPAALRHASASFDLSAPGLERGWALRTLAAVGRSTPRAERREQLERSLSVGRDLGAFRLVTSALTHLGDLARQEGDGSAAVGHLSQVLEYGADHVDHEDYAESVVNLVALLVDQGQGQQALDRLQLRPDRTSTWTVSLALVEATAELSMDRPGRAGQLLSKLLKRITRTPDDAPLPALAWGSARAAERLTEALRSGAVAVADTSDAGRVAMLDWLEKFLAADRERSSRAPMALESSQPAADAEDGPEETAMTRRETKEP